jgi:hypothetical protein
VTLLAEALLGRSSKVPVVLVDGFDKIRTLGAAESAFSDPELLVGLDFPLVITGPTALRHQPMFTGLRSDIVPLVHHNFPVVDAGGEPRRDGIGAVCQMLDLRLGGEVSEVFEADVPRRAAIASSGIPREFFKLLADAASLAEDAGAERIGGDHFEAAARDWRHLLQQAITRQDLRVLERARVTRRLGDSERENTLLYNNLIACYPNNDVYFRPHELLAAWVQEEAARLPPEEPE